MKLSEKILYLRKKQGMTQEQLAEKMEVSRQAVSRWESGTALPDVSNIVQLSKIFAVSADYLLNEEYESETEIPPAAAREAPAVAGGRGKKIAAICMMVFGFLGNFVIYILSRCIKVMIPSAVYGGNGEIWYEWSSDHTAYSYRYFIETYSLEFLTALFVVVMVAGIGLFVLSFIRPTVINIRKNGA